MTDIQQTFIYLWSLIIYISFHQVNGRDDSKFGVVYAASETKDTDHGLYCIMYNPKFRDIPARQDQAPSYKLKDLTYTDLCEAPSKPPVFTHDAVAVARGNCTFSEKATLVQRYGGEAVLITSDVGLFGPIANDSSEYDEINISVAVISTLDFKQIQEMASPVGIKLFAPEEPWLDYNLILIWVIAMTTIVAGAFWSGTVKQKEMLRKRKRGMKGTVSGEEETRGDREEEEQETLDVSPKVIFIFVVLMCAMLISLYFLYDYLVYVIIVLFCIASALALYSCLKPVFIRIPLCRNVRIPANRIPLLSSQPEIRRIFLFLACLGVAVFWGVERNEWYAWILQDILGFVFCVHMMKTARLSSLKICTILLVLLFLYDIFFVFITPLFTKSGHSVMVDVATGGGSSTGEMLPMVFKVPRLSSPTMSICSLPFSLLGFGDILIPGLLISYCHGFDLKVSTGRVYFICTVIAYGVGLVVTFVALALMSQGQPALLYLVPCTLLTTIVIGLCRGELKHLWFGELEMDKEMQAPNSAEPTSDANGTIPASGPDNDDANNSSLESDSEQQLLIHR